MFLLSKTCYKMQQLNDIFLQNCLIPANEWRILAKKDEMVQFPVKDQAILSHIKSSDS